MEQKQQLQELLQLYASVTKQVSNQNQFSKSQTREDIRQLEERRPSIAELTKERWGGSSRFSMAVPGFLSEHNRLVDGLSAAEVEYCGLMKGKARTYDMNPQNYKTPYKPR